MSWPAFDFVAGADWRETLKEYSAAQYVGDVDGDGKPEIILGGSSHPETKAGGRQYWGGSLRIIAFEKPNKLKQLHREVWTGIGSAAVTSVCVADVDGDGKKEIITGGFTTFYTFDQTGNRYQGNTRAHIRVHHWNGKSLRFKNELVVIPGRYSDARINSIWAGDIDGDGQVEILCGGSARAGDEEVGWFDLYDGRLSRLKGRKLWPSVKGLKSTVNVLSAADVDSDKKMEVVTAGHQWTGDKLYGHRVRSKGELIAWDLVAADPWNDFKKRADVLWSAVGDFVQPNDMWIGDLLGEKSVEVVTGGIDYTGVFDNEDHIGTNINIWRLAGNTFNRENRMNYLFTTSTGHWWESSCLAIDAADIDKDNQKELLGASELSLKGRRSIGYLYSVNPTKDFMTSSQTDVFERSRSYEITHDKKRADCRTTGLTAVDIDGDGSLETVVSGYYDSFESGVFAFVWR